MLDLAALSYVAVNLSSICQLNQTHSPFSRSIGRAGTFEENNDDPEIVLNYKKKAKKNLNKKKKVSANKKEKKVSPKSEVKPEEVTQ